MGYSYKDKTCITIVNAFQSIFDTVQKEYQAKYGTIKVVNFQEMV